MSKQTNKIRQDAASLADRVATALASEEPLVGSKATLQKGLSFVKKSAVRVAGSQKAAVEEPIKSGGRQAASSLRRVAVPVGAGAMVAGVVAAILLGRMRLARSLNVSAQTDGHGPDGGSRETSPNGRRTWDAPSMAAQVGRIS